MTPAFIFGSVSVLLPLKMRVHCTPSTVAAQYNLLALTKQRNFCIPRASCSPVGYKNGNFQFFPRNKPLLALPAFPLSRNSFGGGGFYQGDFGGGEGVEAEYVRVYF